MKAIKDGDLSRTIALRHYSPACARRQRFVKAVWLALTAVVSARALVRPPAHGDANRPSRGMRRRKLISRLTTFLLATLVCLLLAVFGPMLLNQRTSDEPFAGYAVMALPRDHAEVASSIRLSGAPDLTLNRGTLFADGNATTGMPISRFVLDAAVFY